MAGHGGRAAFCGSRRFIWRPSALGGNHAVTVANGPQSRGVAPRGSIVGQPPVDMQPALRRLRATKGQKSSFGGNLDADVGARWC